MAKKVGKWKTEIRFDMLGPYETGPSKRCILQYDTDHLVMSIPEAKSLWMQIGKSLGISEKRVKQALDMVPYDKRPIE